MSETLMWKSQLSINQSKCGTVDQMLILNVWDKIKFDLLFLGYLFSATHQLTVKFWALKSEI